MTKLKGFAEGIGRYFPGDIRKRKNYYMTYTAIFLIMVLIAFGWILFSGRTLIWYTDGLKQHYKAYVYWGQYLRNYIRQIFTNHSFGFPEWDFALGEGNDILHTLQFYVIGDPFSYLSACVPTEYMYIFYNFMMLFKLYLAGITFSAMCAYIRPDGDRWGRMAGTFCYVFSSWAINSVVKHPFFLNPIIFFPLIVLGVEKILKGGRKRTLVFGVFFAAMGNFYFFYQIVLSTVVYVLVRLLILYKKEVKVMLSKVLWIFLSSVLGTLMAAAIVLPTVFVYMADSRLDTGIPFQWIYESDYYTRLTGTVFGGQNAADWLCIGMAGITIVSIILLFVKKGNLTLKVYFAICALIFCIPALGQILNGFSYITNRWSWVFSVLISYIGVAMWEDLMSIDRRHFRRVLVGLVICMVLIIISAESRTKEAFMGLACTFLLMLFVFPERDETGKVRKTGGWKKLAVILVTVANLLLIVFFFNSLSERGWVKELVETNAVDDTSETEVVKAQAAEDGVTGFYRYAGGRSYNAHTLGGLSNPGYYWSLTNPAVSDYIRQMGMTDNVIYMNWGHNRKTGVLTSSAVKYLLMSGEVDEEDEEKMQIPYGFKVVSQNNFNQDEINRLKKEMKDELGRDLSEEQIERIDSYGQPYYLCRNKYSLPLGYVTSNVIPKNVWSKYSPVEKQEAMLQGVFVEEGEAGNYTPTLDSKELSYTDMNFSPEVTMSGNSFVVTKKGGAIKFEIDKVPNADLYVEFKGLKYEGYPAKELYLGDKDKDPNDLYTKTVYDNFSQNNKDKLDEEEDLWGAPETATANVNMLTSGKNTASVKLMTPRARNYADIEYYSFNLGYDKKGVERVRISFSEIGKYTFDSFRIIAVPMDNYADRVEALKANPMKNESITEDTVSGTVSVPEEGGILRLAIPYAQGWKAYVDGKETELLNVDIKYMGIRLQKGEHEIRLIYQTPYLRLGMLISAVSVFLFILGITALPWILRRRKKNAVAGAGQQFAAEDPQQIDETTQQLFAAEDPWQIAEAVQQQAAAEDPPPAAEDDPQQAVAEDPPQTAEDDPQQ